MRSKNYITGGEKIFSIKKLISRAKNNIFEQYEENFKNFFINYTFGGHYSLLAIFDDLKLSEKAKILVPSYACESILAPIRLRGLSYAFYKVNKDLEIDIQDVKNKCLENEIASVIFIDYLGKSQYKDIQYHLDFFHRNSIKIIQDAVHSLCLHNYQIYGDYLFNSFRKLLPFEGSLLLSKEKMNIEFATHYNYKFLYNKRIGQIMRYCHLKFNFFSAQIFLTYFKKAERNYAVDKIYKLGDSQKKLIERIDINRILINSKKFYSDLLDNYSFLTVGYLNDKSFYPLGFYLITAERDKKRNIFRDEGVFCPILWPLPEEVNRSEFSESYHLSENSLVLPLTDLTEEKFILLESLLNQKLKLDKNS